MPDGPEATGAAAVIGASVAGLLATRVLSEHFENVTLIDQDRPAGFREADPRKGAPQGAHIHILWSGGMEAVEALFPGIVEELQQRGGIVYDNSADMRWYHHGVWKVRHRSDLKIHAQSRPLLEQVLRERVLARANVCFKPGFSLTALDVDAQANRVEAIELHDRQTDQKERLDCDLVVDASGRTAVCLAGLEKAGYQPPHTETVDIDIGYATRVFKQPPGDRDWQSMVIYPEAPHGHHWGVIFPIEGDRWIVTLVGVHGRYLDSDAEEDFLEFTRGLDRPELRAALMDAEPLTPVRRIRFRGQQRRYYEKASLPAGIVAIGDALCSLNPLYGQGMTVCSLEAAALDAGLRAHRGRPGDAAFCSDYFERAARVIDTAWFLATNNDFLYPETGGRRPVFSPLLSWYIRRMLKLSGQSPLVLQRFLEVIHFKKPLQTLLTPSMLWRILLMPGPRAAAPPRVREG